MLPRRLLLNDFLRRFQIRSHKWYLSGISSSVLMAIGSFMLNYNLGFDYFTLIVLSIVRLIVGVLLWGYLKIKRPPWYHHINFNHPEIKLATFLSVATGTLTFIADLFVIMSARYSIDQDANSWVFGSMFLFGGVFMAILFARKLYLETLSYPEIAGITVMFLASLGMGLTYDIATGLIESAVLGYLFATFLFAARALMLKYVFRAFLPLGFASMLYFISAGLCTGLLVAYLHIAGLLQRVDVGAERLSVMIVGALIYVAAEVFSLLAFVKGKVAPVMAVLRASPLLLALLYVISGFVAVTSAELIFLLVNIIGMAIGALRIKYFHPRRLMDRETDEQAFLFGVDSTNSSYLSERPLFSLEQAMTVIRGTGSDYPRRLIRGDGLGAGGRSPLSLIRKLTRSKIVFLVSREQKQKRLTLEVYGSTNVTLVSLVVGSNSKFLFSCMLLFYRRDQQKRITITDKDFG